MTIRESRIGRMQFIGYCLMIGYILLRVLILFNVVSLNLAMDAFITGICISAFLIIFWLWEPKNFLTKFIRFIGILLLVGLIGLIFISLSISEEKASSVNLVPTAVTVNDGSENHTWWWDENSGHSVYLSKPVATSKNVKLLLSTTEKRISPTQVIHDPNQITDASQLKVGEKYVAFYRSGPVEGCECVLRDIGPSENAEENRIYLEYDDGTRDDWALEDLGIIAYPFGWNNSNYLAKVVD
jgi:hypothetical protein